MDGGPRDSGSDTGGGGGTGGSGGDFLDQCFASLGTLAGRYQIATKASANGQTRARVALMRDPMFPVSTPGSIPWLFVRFAFEQGTVRVCASQPGQLKYMGSLHNCNDTATVTVGGVVYRLVAPDRSTTKISAMGEAAFPEVTLTNTACRSSDNNMCGSGGPCQ
jgi:hypothetical protein